MRYYLRSLPDCTTWIGRDSFAMAGAERKRRDALFAYRVPAGR
jgi:hypothetical protein